MTLESDFAMLIESASADADVLLDRATSLRLKLAEVRRRSIATPPPASPPPVPPPATPPPPVITPPPIIVSAPLDPPHDLRGFSLFRLPADTRAIYVSASEGRPDNSGLSPDRPMDSIARATALLRDGSADRVLLKAGDVFDGRHGTAGNLAKSGRSSTEPLLFAAYGDGPRPKVVLSEPFLNLWSGPVVRNLAIIGLHLSAVRRDPSLADFSVDQGASHGLRLLKRTENILIEDCRVELFETNIAIGQSKNVRVRRCLVLDAWATSAAFAGQGLYIEKSEGVRIEECLFDHNGWHEQIPTARANIYRHNLYLQSDNSLSVVLRGNVISRAASHGAWMRSGGVCEGNLFFQNALHLQIAGESCSVEANVLLGGRDIDLKTPRGYGMTLFSRRSMARNNMIANKPDTIGYAIGMDRHEFTPPGERRAELVGNLVLAWCGAGIDAENPPDELIATGNQVLRCPAGRPAVLLRRKPARMSFAENRYQSEPDARPDRLFQVAGKDLALADFALMTAESGGLFVGVPPMLPDALAGESVLASIVRQRGRGPGEWPENDTAQAFVSRIPRVM